MRWGLGRLTRKYLRGELAATEQLLSWSFVTPETDTPLARYAMERAAPIAVASDRALFLIMPRTSDVLRMPFGAMDDLRVGVGGGRLSIDADPDTTIGWEVANRSFSDDAHRAFTAYRQKAADVWPRHEPADFSATVEEQYATAVAAGHPAAAAEEQTLQHVYYSTTERHENKQLARAARTRARHIISAFAAAHPELSAGPTVPADVDVPIPRSATRKVRAADVVLLAGAELAAAREAQRVFAFLYGCVAVPAHGAWLYQGAALAEAVAEHYRPTLRDCLTQPGFAAAFVQAQRVVATHAPGLDSAVEAAMIAELRKGTHPTGLDLGTAAVWDSYVTDLMIDEASGSAP